MEDTKMPSGPKSNKLIVFLLVGGSVMMAAAGVIILTQKSAAPEPQEAPPKIEAPAMPKTLVISEPTRPPATSQDTETETPPPEETDSVPVKKTAKLQKASADPKLGTIDPKKVTSFMNARFSQVKQCYEHRLKTKPFLEGKLDLNINISPSGKVTAITVNRDSVRDAEMLGCVKRTIQGWQFPEPDGGRVIIAKAYSFKKKD